MYIVLCFVRPRSLYLYVFMFWLRFTQFFVFPTLFERLYALVWACTRLRRNLCLERMKWMQAGDLETWSQRCTLHTDCFRQYTNKYSFICVAHTLTTRYSIIHTMKHYSCTSIFDFRVCFFFSRVLYTLSVSCIHSMVLAQYNEERFFVTILSERDSVIKNVCL